MTSQHRTLRRHRTRRRGTILVVVMWMVVILTGLLLVFSRSMRVEAIASSNRLASEQATAIERGAEQYVLSMIDGTDGDTSAFDEIFAGNLPLGDGYFWLLKPDPDDEQQYAFGLVDEPSRLSLNYASLDELIKLPGMTEDVADSIIDWRDSNSDVTDQGAEDEYYRNLPEAYATKNSTLETVEELRLVKGFESYTNGLNLPGGDSRGQQVDLLFGVDLNHNGVIDEREYARGGMSTAFNGATSASRGIFPFVTVWGRQYNRDSSGKQRTNINSASTDSLVKILSKTIDPSRAQSIVNLARGGKPYKSVLDFAVKGGMTSEELGPVYDSLSATDSRTLNGLVNILTAPRAVLACLPELEEADADAIFAARAGAGPGDIGWLIDALPPEKCAAIGARITNRSFQYSADIVAVAGDGRAFRRVRIIVDARKSPARIVYRKDLTDLGWPLPEQLRNDLRQGIAPQPVPMQATQFTGTGIR